MDELKAFHEAVRHPESVMSSIKNTGRKIMGYLCSYAPEELIHSAGYHPLRLFSSGPDILHAEKHLQSYCCSQVRGVLEDCLSGRLDDLSGMVFPHTCDSIQRLSDIWRLHCRHEFFADVIMPVRLNCDSAEIYMIEVLNRFRSDLEDASGKKIKDSTLSGAVDLFARIRKHLADIHTLKSRCPGVISGSDLHALVKGSMIMDRNEVADRLSLIHNALAAGPFSENHSTRVILSGAMCDLPDIYSVIEQAGGTVVADDLCSGLRWIDRPVSGLTDPIRQMAASYMNRITCPAKHQGITARGEHLSELVKIHDAAGVIFILPKFCDPHGFDYPYLKDFLQTQGIRSLLIETDANRQVTGQMSTRIETFLQMIQ